MTGTDDRNSRLACRFGRNRPHLRPTIAIALGGLVSVGCVPRTEPEVSVSLGRNEAFLVTSVANRGDTAIRLPMNPLDPAREPEIQLEIASHDGTPLQACDGINYIHGPETASVAPGGTRAIELPISAVAVTYCLEAGTTYRARAVLARHAAPGIDHAIESAWVGFVPKPLCPDDDCG
jgi:hypothetical protein